MTSNWSPKWDDAFEAAFRAEKEAKTAKSSDDMIVCKVASAEAAITNLCQELKLEPTEAMTALTDLLIKMLGAVAGIHADAEEGNRKIDQTVDRITGYMREQAKEDAASFREFIKNARDRNQSSKDQ